MKLLFLVSSMEGGGAERVAALLCNAWVSRGWYITLMPTFSGRGGISYPVSEQVDIHYLADDVNNRPGKISRLIALRRHILNSSPDVIVSFLPHVNIAALMASVGTGVPVIACERTYPPLARPPLPYLYRVLRRIFYARASFLIAQTSAIRPWFQARFAETPIATIPNPVQYPLLNGPTKLDPDSIVGPAKRLLLGIGRFNQYKRFDILIQAFARLAAENPDWSLVILGEGSARSALEGQVEEVGLKDRVHFPGFVGNLADWYSRSDLYVMTSAYEGFPNTLLEAMAHGLPTVSFDVKTGPMEITKNGQRGVLLPDDNHVNRLCHVLAQLMSDGSLRENFALRAVETREVYSMCRVLDMWDDAIQKAVDGTKNESAKS